MIKNVIIFIILILIVFGCGSKKAMLSSEVTTKIKPYKQLEIIESDMQVNLIVEVQDIADMANSNKNYFKLHLNNNPILPENKTDNATEQYIYQFKLLPGYYKLRGSYHWHDGWESQITHTESSDLIRIDDDTRTLVNLTIPKDWRGNVSQDNLYFKVSREPLPPQHQIETSVMSKANIVQDTIKIVEKMVTSDKPTRVKLQINTDPTHCDVYINDELIGKSPTSFWVDNNTNHVVQLRHDNYRTAIRLISQEDLIDQDKMIIIERLEKLQSTSVQKETTMLATPTPQMDVKTTMDEKKDTTAIESNNEMDSPN